MVRGCASPVGTPTRTSRARTPAPLMSLVSHLAGDGEDLTAFLADLFLVHGLDFRTYATVLAPLDYTPDVLPLVDAAELRELLEMTPGKVLKIRQFATKWWAELERARA
jgi:hypothetical protein